MFIRIEDLKIPATTSPMVRELLEAQVEALNACVAVKADVSYEWIRKGLMAMTRATDDAYSPRCQDVAKSLMDGYFKIATVVSDNNTPQEIEIIRSITNGLTKLEVAFAQLHAIESGAALSFLDQRVTLH